MTRGMYPGNALSRMELQVLRTRGRGDWREEFTHCLEPQVPCTCKSIISLQGPRFGKQRGTSIVP